MSKFIRKLARDFLVTPNTDTGRKTTIKAAPVLGCKDASSTSSKINLDYSRFDKIIADLDREEDALRNSKSPKIPSDKCDRDDPQDSHSNGAFNSCSHDHSSERRIFEKSGEEKLKAIRLFRGEGNDHFKSKSYDEALICYKRALLYLDYSIGENDSEENCFETERLKCHLNLAAVYLERKMYDETINQCRLALLIEPNCVKAFFRRGVAHLGKDNLEEAQMDLYAALKRGSVDGRDTVNAIEEAIRDLNVKWREYRRRSKAVAQSAIRA